MKKNTRKRRESCTSHEPVALAVQRDMFVRLSETLGKRKQSVRLFKKCLAAVLGSLVLTLILPILLISCSREHRGIFATLTAIFATLLLVFTVASIHGVRVLRFLGKDIKWLEDEIERLES